ncbi:Uncharacterised protein [Tatumella ptyseos]|uniref:Uncharacterized protein n=1 Tax=Tatumella ptyseos TaxID=82987 RepID=A0A2X5R9R2_9GAMM|nr:Uncharacterised protein [Tatumella ptyseos]
MSLAVVFSISDREYSVRFIIRLAACNPLRATGQRAHGRALCTPGLATSLPAAARYLHSFMCPLRTGHDSLHAQHDLSPRPCGSSWTYSLAQRCDVAVIHRVGARRKPGDFSLDGLRVLNSSVIFISDSEYSVRFIIRLAACNPPWATGQRAHGRASALPALRQACPPLRGTFTHSYVLYGPVMIRSCSARPLAASMRLVLAIFTRSAVRCRGNSPGGGPEKTGGFLSQGCG